MSADLKEIAYYTCSLANFPRVCFRAKSVGTTSNIKTKNCEKIYGKNARPRLYKLIVLTKSTTILTRPEFNQQFYNSRSLLTEIEVMVKTEIELEVESEVGSKIVPQVKLEVELKVESDNELEIESDVKLEVC